MFLGQIFTKDVKMTLEHFLKHRTRAKNYDENSWKCFKIMWNVDVFDLLSAHLREIGQINLKFSTFIGHCLLTNCVFNIFDKMLNISDIFQITSFERVVYW